MKDDDIFKLITDTVIRVVLAGVVGWLIASFIAHEKLEERVNELETTVETLEQERETNGLTSEELRSHIAKHDIEDDLARALLACPKTVIKIEGEEDADK